MKTALIPTILACVTLCGATQPEISPTPTNIKDTLKAAYAGESKITLSFEFTAPKEMTLIGAQDYELMSLGSVADSKSVKKAGRSIQSYPQEKGMVVQLDIKLPPDSADKIYLMDSILRLTAAKKSEQVNFELSSTAKTSIPYEDRTYTFEPKKDGSLELSFDKSGKDASITLSFLPNVPESQIEWGDKVIYRFKEGLPAQVQLNHWSELSYYNYRLLYQVTPGFFSFVPVPLAGEAAHNIEMKFDNHAFLSEPHEKDAIFTISPPAGQQMSFDFSKKTVQAYTVGKEGKLQSLQAYLLVDSYVLSDTGITYSMRIEFPRCPEGVEVMVDDRVNFTVWKLNDEANKQESSTPLRFRFKPLTVEKMKVSR